MDSNVDGIVDGNVDGDQDRDVDNDLAVKIVSSRELDQTVKHEDSRG